MKNQTEILTQEAQPAIRGSAVRPHEEQTTLERVMRSHLWQPQDQLARAVESLPKHVKRQEYKEAADCQETIWKAESQIKDWEYMLELYEQEFKAKTDSRAVEHEPANEIA